MIIGFTGTRWGMTDAQKRALHQLLQTFEKEPGEHYAHHGDCVGADDEFANIVDEVFAPRDNATIVCHPPIDETRRAHNVRSDEELPPLSHFARSRAIVDACEVLIGCPREATRQERGGTWYTLDYGRKKSKPLIVIWPDGTMSAESADFVVDRI